MIDEDRKSMEAHVKALADDELLKEVVFAEAFGTYDDLTETWLAVVKDEQQNRNLPNVFA